MRSIVLLCMHPQKSLVSHCLTEQPIPVSAESAAAAMPDFIASDGLENIEPGYATQLPNLSRLRVVGATASIYELAPSRTGTSACSAKTPDGVTPLGERLQHIKHT
ncbi:MAG: hypothetical protein NZ739_11520 [Verrucomicrobiae bacterium]|nr:hypothetical protein [Verrucomicrobiae bacterium]MCX7723324.1 hypothetical protein [Verrucomicrobiae bacterium]